MLSRASRASALLRSSSVQGTKAYSSFVTNTPNYDIKRKVDEYAYFLRLNKEQKNLVYRKKNEAILSDLSSVNDAARQFNAMNSAKKNPFKDAPLIQKSFLGVPSPSKFSDFIDGLVAKEELDPVMETFKKVDVSFKSKLDVLSPHSTRETRKFKLTSDILNSYILKSLELDPENHPERLVALSQLQHFKNDLSANTLNLLTMIKYMNIKKLKTPFSGKYLSSLQSYKTLERDCYARRFRASKSTLAELEDDLKVEKSHNGFKHLLFLTSHLQAFMNQVEFQDKIAKYAQADKITDNELSYLQRQVSKYSSSVDKQLSTLTYTPKNGPSSRFGEYHTWRLNSAISKEYQQVSAEFKNLGYSNRFDARLSEIDTKILKSLTEFDSAIGSIQSELKITEDYSTYLNRVIVPKPFDKYDKYIANLEAGRTGTSVEAEAEADADAEVEAKSV